MSIKSLFVLGAGASFSATRPKGTKLKQMRADSYVPPPEQTPLDKNFIRALLDMRNQQKASWVRRSLIVLTENWKDSEPWESRGLEAAIQFQAASMEFVQKIAENNKDYSVGFEEYLDHLVHLIALRLRMRGTRPAPAKRGRKARTVYEEFVKKHFLDLETKNRIITFNYDDALDDFLLGAQGNDFRKVYFSNLKSEPGEKISSSKSEKPILLKLHGSVNWNCESAKFREIFREDSAKQKFDLGDIWFEEVGSPKVDDKSSPCIIPPIAFKPITKVDAFRHLWKIAFQYLQECEELYFCGYSLPETDALGVALFNNVTNERLQKITVVDSDNMVFDRLKKIIHKKRVPNAKWEYRKDFRDFVFE